MLTLMTTIPTIGGQWTRGSGLASGWLERRSASSSMCNFGSIHGLALCGSSSLKFRVEGEVSELGLSQDCF